MVARDEFILVVGEAVLFVGFGWFYIDICRWEIRIICLGRFGMILFLVFLIFSLGD